MKMCKGKLRIQESLKKLLAAILALFMMSSYVSLYANVSKAETTNEPSIVTNWLSFVRSYGSKFSYFMNESNHYLMQNQEKYLFYDTTGRYMNLTCIRTGNSHANIYKVVDLYKLREQEPEVYNILYGDRNMNVSQNSSEYNQYISNYSGDRRYQHILWEISHFYLFTDGNTQVSNNETAEDRSRRFNEFNNFINEGVSEENKALPPFGNDATITDSLYNMSKGGVSGQNITRYLNEQLIKTMQNELLMIYTNQTYNRKSNVENFSYMNNPSLNDVNKYGRRIFDAFTDMSKSENYDPETDHYEYTRGDVTIETDNTEADTPIDTSKKFIVTNPYKNHATITVKEVRVNGNLTDNYTILNENNETLTKEEFSNLASTNDTTAFRIQAEDMDTVDVKLNVDYGDIINAQLLIPLDANNQKLLTGNNVRQTLININKEHKQYDINSNAELDRKFDLSLTKQITKVTPGADSEETNPTEYTRLNNIDFSNLTNKTGNNAKYFMDKSYVTVEPDSTVRYVITVYNEGQIDGFAEKITDYIPAKLQFDPNSEINKKYGWKQESEGVISTEYLSSKINNVQNPNSTNVLKAFNKQTFTEAPVNEDGTRDTSVYQTKATVQLELTVLPLTDAEKENSSNSILDNRAEISVYGYFKDTDGDGTKEFIQVNAQNIDRDSVQDTAKTDVNGTTALDVVNDIEQRIANTVGGNYSYTDKNNISYQDDDDIERLLIVENMKFMDLALRKWIYEVDGESLSTDLSRQSIEQIENPRFKNPSAELAQECIRESKEQPFRYSNQKVAVPVKPGSRITYKIGIYNQGSRSAYAEEVTDYLPKGLKLAENSRINNEYGWEEIVNTDGTRTVKTTKLAKSNGTSVDGQLWDTSLENAIKNTNNILAPIQAYTLLFSGRESNDYLTSYKELMIECEVTDDAVPFKYLTNRAEITKYGYYINDRFVECNKPLVDKDSEQDGIKNNLNLDNTYEEWHRGYDPGTPFAGNMIDQDDDDFETVYVKVNNGKYQLDIVKIDCKNEGIIVDNIEGIFNAKLNGADMVASHTFNTYVTYKVEDINSVGEDTIIITEVNSPAGYIKTAHKIKLYIEKYIDGDTYASRLTKLELLNDDNSVYRTYTSDDMEDFDYTDSFHTDSLHTGRTGKKLDFEDGYINDYRGMNYIVVDVKNQKLDVALKKSITKVTHNNETKDVKIDNGFNVGRYDNNGSLITTNTDGLYEERVNNATYEMNKTPVEVSKGDEVEYEVRLFNEGQIKANASIVTDYIPTGLKVERVYYRDSQTPLTANQNEGNSYTYDEANGELKVYLRDADLINAYSKENGLQYDYIRVVCSVKDDAEGILTNVAEISEYVYETKDGKATTMVDYDSTADNWNAPSNDKASPEWRNYTNNQNVLDGERHKIESQDSSISNLKGDDDDFDKVIVKGQYELVINKIDETGATVSDVPFTIVRTQGQNATYRSETLVNNQANSTFNISDETSPVTEQNQVKYEITEGINTQYDQVKGTLDLVVNIQNGQISEYKINALNSNNGFTSDATKDYYFTSTMGSQVKVTVNFDATNSRITLTIENKKISDNAYSVKVRKVSADDNTKVLSGVKFSGEKGITTDLRTFNGNTISYEATTQYDGIATIEDNHAITNDNYTKVDKYTISEIDLGSDNSTYTKLNTALSVFVEKQYNKSTLQYQVKSWGVTIEGEDFLDTRYNKICNGNGSVYIDEGNLRYVITASESNGVITINIPNMPSQRTSIKVVKVDKDRPEVKLSGAKIQIIRQTPNTILATGLTNSNGEISGQVAVEADTTSIKYLISELKAADGYDNVFNGKHIELNLTLSNGVITGIDSMVVRDNATGNIDSTLTSPDYFEAAISADDNHEVIVTIKNKITDKVVDLALKKVITEVAGKQVKAGSSFNTKYSRFEDSIDTQPLDDGKNDAIYNLNKTPIMVTKGLNIKYQIRIYNESKEIAATASEITDYIPTGLKLVNVYYNDNTLLTRDTDYTYDETNNVMKTKILSNKDLIPAYIPGDSTTGAQGTLSKEYITVECVVEDDASGILTNVAEITEYTTLDRDENRVIIQDDRDSTANDWVNPNDSNPSNNTTTPKNTNQWINYSGDEDNRIEEGVTKSYPGQEDDDDFEKVVVGEVDLVLKKIIIKVNDVTENDFEESFRRFQNGNIEVDTTKMNNITDTTTAEYMLNKTPVPVNVDDVITYQLRVYNEGDIKAAAKQIKDYIPKGLDLQNVYMNGMLLTEGFDYTISNNVLTIDLERPFIPSYDGEEAPEFDGDLTVECKVNGDVRGLLTNVAEISKYETIFGETDVDRDSETTEPGEWKAPEGSDKSTLDGKSGEPWSQYYNTIEQGKFKDYPGQQDDDDFEKIFVQSKYTVRVRKVNGIDNNSALQGAEFSINNMSYTSNNAGLVYENEVTLTHAGNSGFEADQYDIEETSTGADFDKLYRKIRFDVRKNRTSTGEVYVQECAIDYLGLGIDRGRLQIDGRNRTYEFNNVETESGDKVQVKLNVIYEDGEYTFELVIANTPKAMEYDVFLNKVDIAGASIDGVKFNVNSNISTVGNTLNSEITTQGDENLVAACRVTSDNYKTVDTYSITEIETAVGLLKLDGELSLNVTKGLTQAKDKYEITNIGLTFGNLTSVFENNKYIIKNVPIANTDKTIDITAELGDKEIEYETIAGTGTKNVKAITITIPNEPLYDGNYKIQLNKKDQNRNFVSNVKFAITSENESVASNIVSAEVTTNGTATPIDIVNANITKDNYTVSDIYTISETEAAEGYYILKDDITVRVEKQINSNNTAYEIKKFYVNNKQVPSGSEGLTIYGLELSDAPLGATVSLNAKIVENNTLVIEAVNREKIGNYNIFIYKVDNFDKMLDGVEFTITGRESNNAVLGQSINSPITTNSESAIKIVDRYMGKNNVDTEDVYTITETNTPDGYYELVNPITVRVTKKYGGYGITVNKVYINDIEASIVEPQYLDLVGTDKKAKLVTLVEGRIISIKIENVVIDGSYGIDLIKVDENNNNLANTKFEITGKDSDNNELTTNIPSKEITTDGTATPKTVVAARIDAENVEKVDTYSIKEIEVPNGYYKLKDAIEVKFEKAVSANGDGYVVNKVTVNGTEIGSEEVTIGNMELESAPRDITAVVTAKVKEGNVLELKVQNIPLTGAYLMYLNKVDENGDYVKGASFEITGVDSNNESIATSIPSKVVTTNGTAQKIVDRFLTREAGAVQDIYTIKETNAAPNYFKLKDSITVRIEKQFGQSEIEVKDVFVKVGNGQEQKVTNGRLVISNLELDGSDKTADIEISIANGVITVTVENKLKEFDLSLRKFISKVNNGELTGDKSREPVVKIDTLINGDPKKNGEKTATYIHPKDALVVSPLDLVEYTLRIYNEGEMDGFAKRVIDDVPAGVVMVAPKYDETGKPANLNAEYRWKMFKEISAQDAANVSDKEVITYAKRYYVETENAEEAVVISTDYLSKVNGEAKQTGDVNPNLIKAFDGSTLDYKDIKVQFKVKRENEPNKIITNYAQISEHETLSGIPVDDRDSTPNEWNKDEDDQDIEKLTVRWFDLALYKWVSSTIVTEDGKTTEYESGHTQDDKSKIVNVTIASDKLDKTVVKFKWTIKVENQGTIPGYAKGVSEYIPEGLRFLPEDNNETWTMYRPAREDDKPEDIVVIKKQNYVKTTKPEEATVAVTDELNNTLLNPKDTAEVTLILTWVNGKNNLGAKVNNAEIYKDYNVYGAPDIDSTPNNFTGKPVEDDEDADEVRLNIKTGNGIEMTYVAIGLMVVIVIAAGVYGIKKYVM